MQTRFGVECHFFQDATVRVYADKLATHLFRIAQDAVNNSIKHGRPKRIDIKIASNDEGLQLSITDDGVGIPEDLQRSRGLGL
jgi:two-component system sensor kinase FixL